MKISTYNLPIVTLKAFYPLALQVDFLVVRRTFSLTQILLRMYRKCPALMPRLYSSIEGSLGTLYGVKSFLVLLLTSVLAIAAFTDFAGFLT